MRIRVETQQLCELTVELSDEMFISAYAEMNDGRRPYDYINYFRHPVHWISFRRVGSAVV